MKQLITFAVWGLALLVAGCASSGNASLSAETEQSVRSKITEGKTTMSEVKALWGSPLKTSFTESGQEIWNYMFSKTTMDAVSIVPIVSAFGSSASGTRKELVVMFDREGVVRRFSMSESAVKHGSGVFSQ